MRVEGEAAGVALLGQVGIGSIYAPGESQVTHDLNEEGIRIYDRLEEIAQILSRMHRYYSRRSSQ